MPRSVFSSSILSIKVKVRTFSQSEVGKESAWQKNAKEYSTLRVQHYLVFNLRTRGTFFATVLNMRVPFFSFLFFDGFQRDEMKDANVERK